MFTPEFDSDEISQGVPAISVPMTACFLVKIFHLINSFSLN